MKSILFVTALLSISISGYATPIKVCGPYVKTLVVGQGITKNDYGMQASVTFSNGKTITFGPRAQTYSTDFTNHNGFVSNVPTGIIFQQAPASFLVLLTASYINQKPVCYWTSMDGDTEILAQVSFN